ncbi:DUF2958 domain-containing protein [Agrobacterium pusense]|uniref:DUF2958 domain-containing protein n=1 Tax=Agrobacterium pusense TaxID=648995 RepID=UPI0005142455|nr:DUF2958 domain-containing protein [Agrobacterium pusense]ANV23569.1 hypothetical protein BA939_06195 [Rhizobium sp. S41]KGE83651.1 hypothetical protein LW14_04085 [Rhizobium sp. H41]QWW73161.1 DUF2958 domain-containing protein [Agrobacterium pusense]WCK23274.1 DUF2958 domain-containing protein [Agrobacterium pusense]
MEQDLSNCSDERHRIDRDTHDLALIFLSDFYIGERSIYRIKPKQQLWIRYATEGEIRDNRYFSALSWRAVVSDAIREGRRLEMMQADTPDRLRQLFPPAIMRELAINAKAPATPVPVVKLYHPESQAMMILTRSRCRGHAVDALHNVSGIGPVYQPIWIADIMRLNTMLGLRFVRDTHFQPALPISCYIEAAGRIGRILDGAELSRFPFREPRPRLLIPEPSATLRKLFDAQFRDHPLRGRLRDFTVYEELFSTRTGSP